MTNTITIIFENAAINNIVVGITYYTLSYSVYNHDLIASITTFNAITRAFSCNKILSTN